MIYRERRKARGVTSETAARQIGLRRLHEVLRRGPNPREGGRAPCGKAKGYKIEIPEVTSAALKVAVTHPEVAAGPGHELVDGPRRWANK